MLAEWDPPSKIARAQVNRSHPAPGRLHGGIPFVVQQLSVPFEVEAEARSGLSVNQGHHVYAFVRVDEEQTGLRIERGAAPVRSTVEAGIDQSTLLAGRRIDIPGPQPSIALENVGPFLRRNIRQVFCEQPASADGWRLNWDRLGLREHFTR